MNISWYALNTPILNQSSAIAVPVRNVNLVTSASADNQESEC